MSDYYFEGDPSVDSPRRQLERLLREENAPRRRWWIAAVFAGGGSLYLWHLLGRFKRQS